MNYLKKWVIGRLLKKNCPNRFPRSGPAGEEINCFSIYLYNGNVPIMCVDSITENGLQGKYWNNINTFENDAVIPFSKVAPLTIQVLHFKGLYQTRYDNFRDYILKGMTQLYRCSIIKDKFITFSINTKKYTVPPRSRILEIIVERAVSGNRDAFSRNEILCHIFNEQIYRYKKYNYLDELLNLYLKSLIHSGDLVQAGGHKYNITGSALVTVDLNKQKERMHSDAQKMNTLMVMFTFILAITSIINIFKH